MLLRTFAHSEEHGDECARMEWDERIKIATLAVDGGVGGKQDNGYQKARAVAYKACGGGEQKQEYAQKLYGVPKLVAALGEVCYGYKRHIEYHLGDQPPDANGKISKDKTAHHRERIV